MNKNFVKIILFLIVVFGVSQVCFGETPDTAVVADAVTGATQPDFKATMIKFGTVMFAVMLSSFAIFIGLSLWNVILERSRAKNVNHDLSLKTPRTVDDAVLMFIHKNRLK